MKRKLLEKYEIGKFVIYCTYLKINQFETYFTSQTEIPNSQFQYN